MIIHSTFTNGYFNYAKLFLKSFKNSNGSDYKIVFTTSDLTEGEIDNLKKCYKKLSIHNKKFDYTVFCEALSISKKRAKSLKYQVEHENARKDKLGPQWKMHVAAENRVKVDIPFVMNEYSSEDVLVHFDIDMYFKKSITPILNIMKQNEFTVMYRPYVKKEWRKIWMCAMGIKLSNINSKRFIEEWGKELDKIPLGQKPFAYGQTSCYRVYKRFLKNSMIRFGNISENYIVPGVTGKEDAIIISGNKSSIGKDGSLKLFNQDFVLRSDL